MDTEKVLSPRESLDLIAEVIAKTKENFKQHSFLLILWGWLLCGACIAFFLIPKYTDTDIKYDFLPFPIVGSAGLVITIIYFIRKKIKSTETYLNFFLDRMWVVIAICFIAIAFISVSLNVSPIPFNSILAFIGIFISGWVMQFKPLIAGGILFFVSAVISVYVADEYKVGLLGITALTGFLIPGYLLKYSK